jgi:thioredoxin reductase
MREVGSGSLGIAGTRPAGVFSALQALELLGVTGRLPGRRAVVWGTHDLALRTVLALGDAGVAIERVVEDEETVVGSQALLDEVEKRGIVVQRDARVAAVAGKDRLESVTLEHDGTREDVVCDLLVVSARIVAE